MPIAGEEFTRTNVDILGVGGDNDLAAACVDEIVVGEFLEDAPTEIEPPLAKQWAMPLVDPEYDVAQIWDAVGKSLRSRGLPIHVVRELMLPTGTVQEFPPSGRDIEDDDKGEVRGVSANLATCVSTPLTTFGDLLLLALLKLSLDMAASMVACPGHATERA